MRHNDKHIIFIGFKHVGKSIIGRDIALKLQREFIDLDHCVESLYKEKFDQTISCNRIMRSHGELFFREIEHEALSRIINARPAVISLGGGTPLDRKNQVLINSHVLVHVIAPLGIVFERIMVNGRPAFFSEDENLFDSFHSLWEKRKKIYEKLANVTIDNNSSIAIVTHQLLRKLNIQELRNL